MASVTTPLTSEQVRMFTEATTRRTQIEKLHRDCRADAETLNKELRGVRVRKGSTTYEITDVSSDYKGGFQARGYRIVKSGGRGTQRWDIGALYPACFILDDDK